MTQIIDHPVQKRIVEAISEVCRYPAENIALGVDGCGVPVHQMPLYNLAFGLARLASLSPSAHKYANELKAIREAMTEHPEMVGGTGRFDTLLMHEFGGSIVAKAGAEGVQAVGVTDGGIGIAIKIEDGNGRACSAVTMNVLKQLSIGNGEIYERLQSFIEPAVKNKREELIGSIQAEFELKKEAAKVI